MEWSQLLPHQMGKRYYVFLELALIPKWAIYCLILFISCKRLHSWCVGVLKLYHRKCYQYFTLKRSIEKIENHNIGKSEILNTKLQEIDNFNSQEDDIRTKRGEFGNSVNSTVLLPKKCLFCKKDKYVKRTQKSLQHV